MFWHMTVFTEEVNHFCFSICVLSFYLSWMYIILTPIFFYLYKFPPNKRIKYAKSDKKFGSGKINHLNFQPNLASIYKPNLIRKHRKILKKISQTKFWEGYLEELYLIKKFSFLNYFANLALLLHLLKFCC